MADTTGAPTAPPTQQAQPQAQPATPGRDPENGRFTRDGRGQPAPQAKPAAQVEAPRRFKLPTGEEVDEQEALAELTERRLDTRAMQAKLKRLQELEAAEARRAKDPFHGLDTAARRQWAIREAQAWQREQEEANLPPEQKALLQRARDLEAREAKLKEEEERRAKEAEEAQMVQLREETVETVKLALDASGLPKTAPNAKRLLGIMRQAALSGVEYPPEVLARKLRAQHDAETAEHFKALGGAQALKRYGLVELLNGLEDPEALRLLAPLGERLRKLNLEAHGLAPAAPAQPSNVRQLPTPAAKPGQREDPHEVQKRIEARVRGR